MYQPEPGDYNQLVVHAPDSEDPEIPYTVNLWVDYVSGEYDTPFTAGSVIPVSWADATPMPSSFTVDFYDE